MVLKIYFRLEIFSLSTMDVEKYSLGQSRVQILKKNFLTILNVKLFILLDGSGESMFDMAAL